MKKHGLAGAALLGVLLLLLGPVAISDFAGHASFDVLGETHVVFGEYGTTTY